MVVHLEMPIKDVESVLLRILYHRPSIPSEVDFSVNCADQYVLPDQFHLMRCKVGVGASLAQNGAE